MADSVELETKFTANMRQLERELSRMQALNQRTAQNLSQSHQRAAKASEKAWQNSNISRSLERQFMGMKSSIAQFAPMIAGAFSANEAIKAADGWTRFNNQLKVAGLEGENLVKVRERLFASATRNGVQLESLGTLYSKAAQVQKDLGASQEELLRFTDGVAAALRIQGVSAQQAQGALMQLGQALGSGKVRAEEFNSVQEGALPILQAVARNIDGAGGSVAKLKQLVVEGKLSSQQFFQAFLAGSKQLEEQASRTSLTVAQAFTNLESAFTKFIGEANEASGVTNVLTAAIQSLANNLPTVAKWLAIIGAMYAATFIPSIAAATTALVLKGAAAYRAATALAAMSASMGVGTVATNTLTVAARGLMGVLGGPLGIALTAISAGLAYYAIKSAEATAEENRLAQASAALGDQFLDEETASLRAARAATQYKDATSGLTADQIAAKAATVGLRIEVDKLADAHYRAAAAARVSMIMDQKKRVANARAKAEDRYNQAKADNSTVKPSDTYYGLSGGVRTRDQSAKADYEYSKSDEAFNLYVEQKRLRGMQTEPIVPKKEESSSGGGAAAGTDAKKKSGGPKKASGPSKADIERAGMDALRAADLEYLNAELANAKTAQERYALQQEILSIETAAKMAAIGKEVAEGKITKAAGDQLVEKTNAIAMEKRIGLDREKEEGIARERIAIEEEKIAGTNALLRSEAEQLEVQAELSKNLEKKAEWEYRALVKRQEADTAEFDIKEQQRKLDLQKRDLTQAQIDAIIAAERTAFEDGQTRQSAAQVRTQTARDPNVGKQIEDMASGFGTLNEQIGGIATGALNDLTDGLMAALDGTKSLKEAFGDMAKAIIADLIKMAVRFVIFQAIGMALGIPNLGKAAIGLPTGAGVGNASIPRNKAGTSNFGGGMTMVGEHGPELAVMPSGTQIIPNHVLRNGFNAGNLSGTGGGGQSNVYITNNVNASDAVMTDWVRKEVAKGTVEAVKSSEKLIGQKNNQARRNTFIR